MEMADHTWTGMLLVDQLEYAHDSHGNNAAFLDAEAWYGRGLQQALAEGRRRRRAGQARRPVSNPCWPHEASGTMPRRTRRSAVAEPRNYARPHAVTTRCPSCCAPSSSWGHALFRRDFSLPRFWLALISAIESTWIPELGAGEGRLSALTMRLPEVAIRWAERKPSGIKCRRAYGGAAS